MQVIESEEQQATDRYIARLQRQLKAKLQSRKSVGVVVAIQYLSLPAAKLVKSWLHCVSNYIERKTIDLKHQEFKFDSAFDGRSFWEKLHIEVQSDQYRLDSRLRPMKFMCS